MTQCIEKISVVEMNYEIFYKRPLLLIVVINVIPDFCCILEPIHFRFKAGRLYVVHLFFLFRSGFVSPVEDRVKLFVTILHESGLKCQNIPKLLTSI